MLGTSSCHCPPCERPDREEDAPRAGAWTAKAVSERLVEAFVVNRHVAYKTPSLGYRRPHTAVIAGRIGSRARPTHLIVVPPEAIGRMEEALDWPRAYLAREPHLSEAVVQWARLKAYKLNIREALRTRRRSRTTFLRHRDQGCALIAEGLNRDKVVMR